VAQDDWRIHIEVEEGEHAAGLLDRLGLELGDEAAELARELEQRRLAVSRDGDEIFVYAGSLAEAEQAHGIVEAVLRELGVQAKESRVEHWLEDEERWDDEPPGETWEEEELDRGYAPWEVRVHCGSRHEAHRLAEQLEGEGYQPVRRWDYLIVGTASKEDAERLAQRVHGRVEAGGEVVREVVPGNPFAVFGGLGE
jgi:hypothetical protein